MSGTKPPYKEFRADGWPLCPRCEEDELYSHLMLGWTDPDRTPSVEECIASGMKCYRCSWDSETNGLSLEERSRRMLVVLYKLARGRTDVSVPNETLFGETKRLAVWLMGEDEFAEFHRGVLEEVERERQAENEWPEVIGG